MNTMQVLDRPIAYQRSFVKITGSATAALFLSQCVYWANRTNDKEGWFFKTAAEWQEETGLNRREMEAARRLLKGKGIVDEVLKGVPATLHYRVNIVALEDALAQSSLYESDKLVCTKRTNKIVQNVQTIKGTETTTETTTASKQAAGEGCNIVTPLRERDPFDPTQGKQAAPQGAAWKARLAQEEAWQQELAARLERKTQSGDPVRNREAWEAVIVKGWIAEPESFKSTTLSTLNGNSPSPGSAAPLPGPVYPEWITPELVSRLGAASAPRCYSILKALGSAMRKNGELPEGMPDGDLRQRVIDRALEMAS